MKKTRAEELARLKKMWQKVSGKKNDSKKESTDTEKKFEDVGPGYSVSSLGLSKYYGKA